MTSNKVGIVVGRFQTPVLHEGHIALITHVCELHNRVLIFVGQSPLKNTANDPLDFITRRAMVEEVFPNVEVHRIDDVFNLKRWSADLDRQLSFLLGANEIPILYGSRRSFLNDYKGRHDTVFVTPTGDGSSTQMRRNEGCQRYPRSSEWRRGIVHAAQNRFPTVYTTVDVAAINLETKMVLFGKKPNDDLWRFPGGFADIISNSFEEDAKRELMEETHLVATDIEYVGSTVIDDARYRNQVDKIKTLFFVVPHWEGEAEAGDDLAQVAWLPFLSITDLQLVFNHRTLLYKLKHWWIGRKDLTLLGKSV